MTKKRTYIVYLYSTAFLTMTAARARASGFDLPDLDAFAVGRGMAVVATADNPSAIYFNPAGISQLSGLNLRGGIYGIDLDPSYKSPAGGTYDNQNKFHAIPQGYLTYNYKDSPLTFGMGVYTPFGLGLQWPDDTGFRTVTGGLDSALTYLTFNPVVALKVAPGFSIAGGISGNYAYAHLKQGLLPAPPYNNSFEFKGDGWAVAYNLGALLQPCKELSFGLTFRSSTTVNLKGHTDAAAAGLDFRSDANAEFTFPLEVVSGVSWRPTSNWNFEFDAEYMGWSALQSVNINQASPSPIVPLSSVPVPLDWQSSWYFEWGATRYFKKSWHVSAGFIFNENSVPNTYYTPAVTDMNKYFISAGVGYQGKRFDVDVAYQFGFGATAVGNDTSPAADGSYQFLSNALAVSAGWHF